VIAGFPPNSKDSSPNHETVFLGKGQPTGIVVEPESNTIYISYFSSGIMVLDGNSNRVTNTIKLANVVRLAINPMTKRLYALASQKGSDSDLFVIDIPSQQIIGSIPIHRPASLSSTSQSVISINQSKNEIYVTKRGGIFKPGQLLIIDGSTNLETARIELSDPAGVTCDEKADLIYIANQGSKVISIVDRKAVKVTEAIDLKEVVSVAINPALNVLYAIRQQGWGAEGGGGLVEILHVLDIDSGDTIRKIEFDTDENGFDFNPHLNTLYIKDTANNTFLKFDGKAEKKITEVKMGKVSRFFRRDRRGDLVAVNSKTNKVYVTDHETGLLHIFDP